MADYGAWCDQTLNETKPPDIDWEEVENEARINLKVDTLRDQFYHKSKLGEAVASANEQNSKAETTTKLHTLLNTMQFDNVKKRGTETHLASHLLVLRLENTVKQRISVDQLFCPEPHEKEDNLDRSQSSEERPVASDYLLRNSLDCNLLALKVGELLSQNKEVEQVLSTEEAMEDILSTKIKQIQTDMRIIKSRIAGLVRLLDKCGREEPKQEGMRYMQTMMLTSMQNKANLLEDLSKKRTEHFVMAEEQIMKDKMDVAKAMDQLEREIAHNELHLEVLKSKNQEYAQLHRVEVNKRRMLLKKVKEFHHVESVLDGFDRAYEFLHKLSSDQPDITNNGINQSELQRGYNLLQMPSPNEISPVKGQVNPSTAKSWNFENYSIARSNSGISRGIISPKKSKKTKQEDDFIKQTTKKLGLFYMVFPHGPQAFVELVLASYKSISMDSKLKSDEAFILLQTLKERNRELHSLEARFQRNITIETNSNENQTQYFALLEYFGGKSNLTFSVHPTILKSIYERILSLFVASRKLFDRYVHLVKRIISQIKRANCLVYEAVELERIVQTVEETARERERSQRKDAESPSGKFSVTSGNFEALEDGELTHLMPDKLIVLPHIKSTLNYEMVHNLIKQIKLVQTLPEYCSAQLANSMIADNLVMVFVRPSKLSNTFPGALNHSLYDTLTQDIIGSILGIAHSELLGLLLSKLRGSLRLLEMMQRRTTEMQAVADHKPFKMQSVLEPLMDNFKNVMRKSMERGKTVPGPQAATQGGMTTSGLLRMNSPRKKVTYARTEEQLSPKVKGFTTKQAEALTPAAKAAQMAVADLDFEKPKPEAPVDQRAATLKELKSKYSLAVATSFVTSKRRSDNPADQQAVQTLLKRKRSEPMYYRRVTKNKIDCSMLVLNLPAESAMTMAQKDAWARDSKLILKQIGIKFKYFVKLGEAQARIRQVTQKLTEVTDPERLEMKNLIMTSSKIDRLAGMNASNARSRSEFDKALEMMKADLYFPQMTVHKLERFGEIAKPPNPAKSKSRSKSGRPHDSTHPDILQSNDKKSLEDSFGDSPSAKGSQDVISKFAEDSPFILRRPLKKSRFGTAQEPDPLIALRRGSRGPNESLSSDVSGLQGLKPPEGNALHAWLHGQTVEPEPTPTAYGLVNKQKASLRSLESDLAGYLDENSSYKGQFLIKRGVSPKALQEFHRSASGGKPHQHMLSKSHAVLKMPLRKGWNEDLDRLAPKKSFHA